MPKPLRVIPPAQDENVMEEDLENMKKRRQKRNKPKKSLFEWYERKKQESLKKESQKPRPYQFLTQINLVYPMIFVSPPRSSFTTEPSSHFSLFFRMFPGEAKEDLQFWWGFRLAAFSGTGYYKSTAGRYSYLYLGPMFGIGKLNLNSNQSEKDIDNKKKNGDNLKYIKKSGWFLMGGIAGQTRIAKTDPTDEFTDKDFDSIRWLELDGTGLWAEFTYSDIYFGALGLQYVAGLQLAEGKTFLWLGMGLGGWY